MQLSDLVGERLLTAVEFDTEPKGEYDDRDGNAILFTLDGNTYRVVEDPSDGYRSSMRDIQEVDRVLANAFEPVRVVARHVTGPRGCYGSNDILECIDVVTGKTVLEVGTQDTDDYYPSFVASFTPENMAVNVGR